MGNSHSAQYHKSRFPRRRSVQSTHSVNLTTSALHTPGLSRSSSRTTSRPASVMGDVKDCVSKILGRSSSAFDVSLQSQRSTPRRSFSAPAGCFGSAMLNPSSSSCTATTTATKYCLPPDDKEQDRLTNTHYVLKHCFGDNFSAPVHDLLSKSVSIARASTHPTPVSTTFTKDSASVAPSVISAYSASSVKNSWSLPTTRVLDVACGSGVWLLEMATEYPHAQFYGIDVASIFPQCIKPPNTTFQQHDLLDKDGFPYPEEYFDYIHMRLVYNCFSKADLKFVLAEVNRILKPGGYVEIRDLDPIIKHPGPLSEKTFADFATRMSQLNSVDVTWTLRICEILASQGELTDIYHQKVSVGFGEDGPIAASMESSICDAIKSYKTFFMEAYKLSSAQCEKMIDEIIQESKSHHSYFNYYMGWGRKPLIVMDTLVNNNDCMAPVTPTASSTNITAVVDGSALASPSMASSTSATTALNCCVNTFPTANAATTLSVENAFDIVQLTHGYTE